MYSRGMRPPLMASMNSKPLPGCGSSLSQTSPYWPRPPDCLTNLPWCSTDFLDFLALVGVHLQQAPDALLLALHRGVHRVAGTEHARIHADEGKLTDERVGHDLERERGERLVVVRRARRRLAVLGLALHRRDVERRGQVINHRIEHRLHALVLERGAAQHRHDLVGDGAQSPA